MLKIKSRERLTLLSIALVLGLLGQVLPTSGYGTYALLGSLHAIYNPIAHWRGWVVASPLMFLLYKRDVKVFRDRNREIAEILGGELPGPVDLHLRGVYIKWANDELTAAQITQAGKLLHAAYLIRKEDYSVQRAFQAAGLLFSSNIVLIDDTYQAQLDNTLAQIDHMARLNGAVQGGPKILILAKTKKLYRELMSLQSDYPNLRIVNGSAVFDGKDVYASQLDAYLSSEEVPLEIRKIYQEFGSTSIIHPSGLVFTEDALRPGSPLKGSKERIFLLEQLLDILSVISKPKLTPDIWMKLIRAFSAAA